MNIQQFKKSVDKAVIAKGIGILDLQIKIEDRATGEFLDVDEVAIDASSAHLRIVVNRDAVRPPAESLTVAGETAVFNERRRILAELISCIGDDWAMRVFIDDLDALALLDQPRISPHRDVGPVAYKQLYESRA